MTALDGPRFRECDLAHEENAARRELVLRHPMVARKLTARPLEYAEPGQWNGFVPPAMWRERHNDSPRRTALLELAAEARQHETDGCTCREGP
jgi:hypothetical protein